MSPSRSRRPACPRCAFRGGDCLCAEIPGIAARTEVVVLRHALERNKQTNSARWAQLALGCAVIDYAVTRAPFDETALPLDGAWLLFPGGEPGRAPAEPPRRLIVPDGTWQQARRMVARLPSLRRLPRLSLGPAPRTPRLRRPHEPTGVSTLEAIAGALALCGEPVPAEALLALHAKIVGHFEKLRGYPLEA